MHSESELPEKRDGVQLTWVGHSTFLVQMEDVNFLTDPIWSKSPHVLVGLTIVTILFAFI